MVYFIWARALGQGVNPQSAQCIGLSRFCTSLEQYQFYYYYYNDFPATDQVKYYNCSRNNNQQPHLSLFLVLADIVHGSAMRLCQDEHRILFRFSSSTYQITGTPIFRVDANNVGASQQNPISWYEILLELLLSLI